MDTLRAKFDRGSWRAVRIRRFLALLVIAMAVYFCSPILYSSPLRIYYYKTTRTTFSIYKRVADRSQTIWFNNSSATIMNITAIIEAQRNQELNSTLILGNLHQSIIGQLDRRVMIEVDEKRLTKVNLSLCDENIVLNFGPIPVNKTEIDLLSLETKYPEVKLGGQHAPADCIARHKVAILVPFRDREQHLAIFLNHMHPFLIKQQIDYGIFIVEQAGKRPFNRAKLLNVGFVESQRLRRGGWQCFVFHDVDNLPTDLRNLYSCPKQPRLMAALMEKNNYSVWYDYFFGGVSAVTLEQFLKVNGFSNEYWGWGAEDDDLSARLRLVGYHIGVYKASIARYATLHHKKAKPNPNRSKLLRNTKKTFRKEGLSTLKYKLVKITKYRLFTHILANID